MPKKVQKSTNTHRTGLCELNSCVTPFNLNINLEKFCVKLKNAFELNIFLSHMEYGWKIKNPTLYEKTT